MTTERNVVVRTPRTEDVSLIVAVVRLCAPFLTVHEYLFWALVRYAWETCAVAELDGELVGWCSIIPIAPSKYFLYQIGVAPKARRLRLGSGKNAQGIAERLFRFIFDKLRGQGGDQLAIEFTTNQANYPALNFFRSMAERAGLELLKTSEFFEQFDGGIEEVYIVKPIADAGKQDWRLSA